MAERDERAPETGSLRRQLFVAPRAQGIMMMHAATNCAGSIVATSLVSWTLYRMLNLSPEVALVAGTAITLLLAIPWVAMNAAKVGRRILGHFIRVQGMMRQIAASDSIEPATIREQDLWREWMQEFNAMIACVHRPGPTPDHEGAEG